MSAALSPVLEPGSVFARDFRIEKPLAEGGMGAVYVAVQLSTGRRRAIKLMHPSLAQDEDARRRFLLEARVGARIASEHLVEVHAAGVDEDTRAPYLVMELLEGEDLQSRLDRAGPLAKEEILELFRQMCHALGAAHALGIVHRDLKPANVFLAVPKRVGGAPFDVKILDFGIAKLTEGASATIRSQTAPGAMIGTPLWMPPEQSGGTTITPTADVWALGLILYNALAGVVYWRTGNMASVGLTEIFREVLIEEMPSPVLRAREQGVAFPAALERVFRGSVVRDPAARYEDARTFLAALEAALAGTTFVPPPRSDPTLALAGTVAADSDPALQRTVASEPELELAVAPSRLGPPPAAAATLDAPPPLVREMPLRAPTATRAVLAEPQGTRIPMLPVVIGLFVFAALVAVVATKALSGAFYSASCRLCTIEPGTRVNGPVPLSEIRHAVEEKFPAIDRDCVQKAEHAGKVTLKFKVRDSAIRERPGFEPVGETQRCIAQSLTFLPIGMAGERILVEDSKVAFTAGPTEVVYVMDFDPKQ